MTRGASARRQGCQQGSLPDEGDWVSLDDEEDTLASDSEELF